MNLIGYIAFGGLLVLPFAIQMYRYGTIRLEAPEKRTHLFEDENGERENPFHVDEDEYEDSEWTYSIDDV